MSLIIQSVLGDIEILSQDPQHKLQYNIDQNTIFQHARRLIRCIVDCQSHLGDSIGIRNALMLVRSFGAKVWDDSPLHLQQLSGLGSAGVRRLIAADIRSIETLEYTESSRIETIMSRNPPFGQNLLKRAKEFPKLSVALRMIGQPVSLLPIHLGVDIDLHRSLYWVNMLLSRFRLRLAFSMIKCQSNFGRGLFSYACLPRHQMVVKYILDVQGWSRCALHLSETNIL